MILKIKSSSLDIFQSFQPHLVDISGLMLLCFQLDHSAITRLIVDF